VVVEFNRARGVLLPALWLAAWWAGTARAQPQAQPAQDQPFAYQGRADVGQPARPAVVGVEQSAQAVEVVVDGVRSPLPIKSPQRADVQSIRLQNGATVALLRVTAAEGREAAALIGRKRNGKAELLWSGALDPRGDPGERRGHTVDVQDHTGDGIPDVVIGQFDERARICGQTRTLLRPQLLEPETLRLRPAALARLPEARAATAEVALTEESPGPTQRPLLRSLRLVGVSSQPGNESEPWLSTLPSALTDGDPATYWSEGHGSGGRGEFASFQWDAPGYEIRALAIVPLPAKPPADRAFATVRSLWLVGDNGVRVKLKLPDRVQAGQRYWASLATPLGGRCVSLVLDQTASPSGKSAPAVLAEVEAYTELDFGGGIDRLVQQLAVGGSRAGDAAQLLGTLGPEVVGKLQKTWPTLPGPGRRRAVRVLAHHAESSPTARELLAAALDDADADVRRAAFAALIEAGPAARALLVPKIGEPGKEGDAAALALARSAPDEAIAALLAALAREGGSERAALREAIALSSRMGGAKVVESVRAWAATGTASVSARASLALALSAVQQAESARPLASELIAGAAPQAEEFEDLWRLVQAARALAPAPQVDEWLAGIAKNDERWMLRAAAVEALAERKAPAAPQAAATALGDAYPRVRAAAATALASHVEGQRLLTEHALRDRWPMVRAASLDALAGQPGAEPVLRKGVGDASRFARAAAIRGLTRAKVRGAWPLVKERLADKKEWPEVLTEAVRFAAELCVHDAEKTLLTLLERGIKPDAWEPDAELGVQALEALLRLGGSAAKAAAALANSTAAPPNFRALIESPPAGRSTCPAAP
jgi:hypothetical protein